MQKTDKLISANALLEKVQFRTEVKGVVGSTVKDVVEITRKLIEGAPAVDAVEVVRCKECVHCSALSKKYPDAITCSYWRIDPTPDHFCASGERRTPSGS